MFIKKEELKEIIYIEELKPEITQCRIVQVDERIEENKDD